MKLVSFEANEEHKLGVLSGEHIYDINTCYAIYLIGATRKSLTRIDLNLLNDMKTKISGEMPSDMMKLMSSWDEALDRIQKILTRMADFSTDDLPYGTIYKFDQVVISPPVLKPGKILCLAGNYAEHIREGGRPVVGKDKMSPRIFMKPSTSLIGHGHRILIPRKGNKIDWEAELAVVIGKRGKYIPANQAYDYVAGYTVFNDVSERELIVDVEREPSEWNRFFDWLNGKWMDTFAPMGPYLVTKDEIPDPHDLNITLKVNGQIKQNSNTKNMIFSIPEIIEFASRLMTLEPGDVIATGTPEGTGFASGTFLKPGDVVEIEIDKIGVLRNYVEAEK